MDSNFNFLINVFLVMFFRKGSSKNFIMKSVIYNSIISLVSVVNTCYEVESLNFYLNF